MGLGVVTQFSFAFGCVASASLLLPVANCFLVKREGDISKKRKWSTEVVHRKKIYQYKQDFGKLNTHFK